MMQTIANIAQIVGLFQSLSGTDANQKFVAAMQHVLVNKIKINKTQGEKMAKEFGIKDQNIVKNLIELAIVHQGRKLAHAPGKTIIEKYNDIVELYKIQTNLSLRTSTSIMYQQYSTPAPIGYLLGVFCGIDKPNTTIFEPSAGNGLLTIAALPSQATVNEYEEVRYENLLTQGYHKVTFGDATQKLVDNKSFDAVITNPPFGKYKDKVNFSGFEINQLEHVMSIRGLQAIKDEGKAAIIIGGHTEYDKNGKIKGATSKDALFLRYLYKFYHVADIIPIDGSKLYSRQGTSFDTRLILINGRKQQARGLPPLNTKGSDDVVNDFDVLFERVMQYVPKQKPTKDLIADQAKRNANFEQRAYQGTPQEIMEAIIEDKQAYQNELTNEELEFVNKNYFIPTGYIYNKNWELIPTNNDMAKKKALAKAKIAIAKALKAKTNTVDGLGMVYTPISNNKFSLKVDTPDSMGYEVHRALEILKQRIGSVDEYVMQKLKYKTLNELHSSLAAEQVDAVALAIYNIEQKSQAIIIADQTGIGKGRQAAAIIRYAIVNGMKPIFCTEKAGLYSDIYRDLEAIGGAKYVPYIINAKDSKGVTKVRNEKGTVIYEPLPSKAQKEIIDSGKLPSGFDYVLTTYYQLQTNNDYDEKKGIILNKSAKNIFINNVAKNSIIILDESHNAGGDSIVGKLMLDNLTVAKGALFLSATFAKTPANMPLYAMKTAIQEASLPKEDLITAIKKGGVALQEVVSSQLVEAGQLIRRERSYEGIEINYITLTEKASEHKAVYDNLTKIIRDIIYFQQEHIDPFVSKLDEIMSAEYKEVKKRKGTDNVGVANAPAFSKCFNLVNQMLLCLKADAVADRTIMRLREGKAPVIAFSNTMGSFLDSMKDESGKPVKNGSIINADFTNVLMAALNGTLRYTITDVAGDDVESFEEDIDEGIIPEDENIEEEIERKSKSKKTAKKYVYVDLGDLTPQAQNMYNSIAEAIRTLSSGLVLSPIDLIKQKIERAGYKVAELTGRKLALDIKQETKEIPIYNNVNNTNASIPANAKALIPPFQLKALKSMLKGEEGEFFVGQINEIDQIGEVLKNRSLESEASKWKKENSNSTESYYNDIALPSLRYFSNSHEIYAYEWDVKNNLLYTFTILNGDTQNAEFGWQSIDEMFANYGFGKNIDLDLYYTPKPISEVLDGMNGLGTVINERSTPQMIPVKTTTKNYFVGTVYTRVAEVNNLAFNAFNNNEVDVLMINQSGSTGASAQAIPTEKVPPQKVKQRVMIVLQAELNINTEVQKRGRINRTGQIIKPIYDYVFSEIPAEKRLSMMLQKKLKSLDANTTSNQKNSEDLLKVDDFLNKYGDTIVEEYLIENPDVNRLIDDPLKLGSSGADSGKKEQVEDAASKVAARVAILPTEMQNKFYNEVLQRYTDYVQELKTSGEYDLELEYMDLQATLLETPKIAKGGKGGTSAFGDNTYLEKHEVNILRKPYTLAELENLLNQKLGGKTPTQYMEDLQNDFSVFIKARFEKELQENVDHYADLIANVSNDKAIKNGEISENERIEQFINSRNKSNERIRETYKNKNQTISNLFEDFYPGKNLRYVSQTSVDAGTPPFCVCLGYTINKNAANPYAPSAMKIHFAIASGRKASTIAASKTAELNAITGASKREYPKSLERVKQTWQDEISKENKDRGVRYIVTGNLLQAFSIGEFSVGKLVQFTTSDGKMRKGLYLDYYRPNGDGVSKGKFVPVIPIYKAQKAINAISQGAVVQFDDFSGYIVKNKYNDFDLALSSKAMYRKKNAAIYLDKDLLPFMDNSNFRTVSDNMVGTFAASALGKVTEILQNKHNINVRLQDWQMEVIQGEIEENKFTDYVEPLPATQEVVVEVPITTNAEALENEIKERFGNNPNIIVAKPMPLEKTNKNTLFTAKAGNKVVDSNGNPLSVFHGAHSKNEFKEFNNNGEVLGIHFGTKEASLKRLEDLKNEMFYEGNPRIIEANIFIKKYLNVKDNEAQNPHGIASALNKQGISNIKITQPEYGLNFDKQNSINQSKILDELKRLGYDGLKYNNDVEGGVSYVVFDSSQVKIINTEYLTNTNKAKTKAKALAKAKIAIARAKMLMSKN